MNISAVNFNNQEDAEKTASINIKSNKPEEAGQSFAAAVVSGVKQSESMKMDQNTYNSLLKEVSSVEEQLKASATSAKDSFGALVKRLSGADYVKIDEDGYSLNDADPEEMINIVERIKITLAAYCDDYQAAGSSVDMDKVQDVVGNTGMANKVAEKMSQMDVPATPENVSAAENALKQAGELRPLTEEEKNYMVKNSLKPTIENIYKAEHLGITRATVKGNAVDLTIYQWKDLEPQMVKVIKSAGLENSEKNRENARNFIENGIPVTDKNLKLKIELDGLVLDDMASEEKQTETSEKIVSSMAEGKNAASTVLTQKFSLYSQVANAINVVNKADASEVAAVLDSGKELTIENLEEALQSDNKIKEPQAYKKMASNIKALAGYIQLQETRILMTAQAGLSLAKQGFNLDTTPIARLVEELKKVYEQELNQLMPNVSGGNGYGIAGIGGLQSLLGTDDPLRLYTPAQMVFEVKKAIDDIKGAPDVSVGNVIKEKQSHEKLTISDFAQTGNQMRQRFKEAGETYEAVGTEVRTDLGDSFTKAVDSSTMDILRGLGLEDTNANCDAVRILGFNRMEITVENIGKVKEVYSTLNNLIDNMKPESVLKMIRDNINPMEDDIQVVNEYLQEQNENVDSVEKYSRFLYKLERTSDVSEEERKRFIGIYKMMNIFKSDAGNAVGALLKQNSEITMGNLLTAYQSRKAAGMDEYVNEVTESSDRADTVNFYKNLFSMTAEHITPDTLKKTNAKQPVMEQHAEQFCQNINGEYDSAAEAEYYKDYTENIKRAVESEERIVKELAKNDMKITINNIAAAENIMSTGYFSKVYGIAEKRGRNDIKNLLDSMHELTGSRQELNDSYDELSEKCSDLTEEILEADEVQEYKDIDSLRMLGKEINMINEMSKKNHYKVPFYSNGEIGTINLTVIQDDVNKGKISVQFRTEELGEISVEARAVMDDSNGMSVNLKVASEENSGKLLGKLSNVKEKLENQGYSSCNMQIGSLQNLQGLGMDTEGAEIPSDQLYETAKNIIFALL